MQLEMEMEMELTIISMGMEMEMEMELEMGMEKAIQKMTGIKKSQQRHTRQLAAQERSGSGAIIPLGCKQLNCESELLAQYKHKKKKAPHAFDMMSFSEL